MPEYWVEVYENDEGNFEAIVHEVIAHVHIIGTESVHYEVRCRMTSAKTSAEEAFQESVNQLARMLELVGVTTFEVVRERAGGSG